LSVIVNGADLLALEIVLLFYTGRLCLCAAMANKAVVHIFFLMASFKVFDKIAVNYQNSYNSHTRQWKKHQYKKQVDCTNNA